MIRNRNDMDPTDGQEPIDYIEYAEMHYDHDRYERAAVACQIATAKAAERQAAALEYISRAQGPEWEIVEDIAVNVGNISKALERIAAVLEGGNDRQTDAFRKVVAALEFGDVATAAKAIKEYQRR